MSKVDAIIGKWVRGFIAPSLAIIIYAATNLGLAWLFYLCAKNLVSEINSLNDYGEHYILYHLLLFLREILAVSLGLGAGLCIDPNNKKVSFVWSLMMWFAFILYLSFLAGKLSSQAVQIGAEKLKETMLSGLIWLIAQATGFLVVGVSIWKEQK
jgi:hypothetical protein